MVILRFLLALSALVFLSSISIAQGFGNATGVAAKNSFSWIDLSFENEKISSIELEIQLATNEPWTKQLSNGGIKRLPKPVTLSVNDIELLNYLQSHIASGAHRPLLRRGTNITSQQIGTIKIITDKQRNIPIQIWAEGFYLGDRIRYSDDRFYCWSLAQLIRDELERHSSTQVERTNFEALSGDKLQGRNSYPRRQKEKTAR